MATIKQHDYGCNGTKLTTFLLCYVPGFERLHQLRRVPRAWDSNDLLKGKELVNGRMVYKTARAKEYPPALCSLLAEALLNANATRRARVDRVDAPTQVVQTRAQRQNPP